MYVAEIASVLGAFQHIILIIIEKIYQVYAKSWLFDGREDCCGSSVKML